LRQRRRILILIDARFSPQFLSKRGGHYWPRKGVAVGSDLTRLYREVALLKQSAVAQEPETPAIAIISYDEKPGVQAIGTTAPDLPPAPLRHDCVAAITNMFDMER